MRPTTAQSWEDRNQAGLAAELADLRSSLEAFLAPEAPGLCGRESAGTRPVVNDAAPVQSIEKVHRRLSTQPDTPLDNVCATFGLSDFDRKILLMCAAVELDSRFAAPMRW